MGVRCGKRQKPGFAPCLYQKIAREIPRCVNKDAVTYYARVVNVYVNQIIFNFCKKVFDKECAPRYKRIIEGQIKEHDNDNHPKPTHRQSTSAPGHGALPSLLRFRTDADDDSGSILGLLTNWTAPTIGSTLAGARSARRHAIFSLHSVSAHRFVYVNTFTAISSRLFTFSKRAHIICHTFVYINMFT